MTCILKKSQYFSPKCLAAILEFWSRGRLRRKRNLCLGCRQEEWRGVTATGYKRDRAPIIRMISKDIRATMGKIKLPNKSHGMVALWIQLRRTYGDFKRSRCKLTPPEKIDLDVIHISIKTDVSRQLKTHSTHVITHVLSILTGFDSNLTSRERLRISFRGHFEKWTSVRCFKDSIPNVTALLAFLYFESLANSSIGRKEKHETMECLGDAGLIFTKWARKKIVTYVKFIKFWKISIY